MGILGNIMSAIFGSKADAKPASSSTAGTSTAQSTGGGASPSSGAGSSQGGSASSQVDVAAILDKAVKDKKQKLEWRTSIVDLMKALDLDSSLTARKELAKDLNYTGDTNDSATMNMWLHKQVMKKVAENGGKVPADLKS